MWTYFNDITFGYMSLMILTEGNKIAIKLDLKISFQNSKCRGSGLPLGPIPKPRVPVGFFV